MKVAIVDYGMGNIKSLTSALQFIGVDNIVLTSSYEELLSSDKLILPGVGSYRAAMKEIKNKKLDINLKDIVLNQHKPILGICLGMQLLGKSSEEEGLNEGLGFIDSVVIKFDDAGLKVPHVGFNQVEINNEAKLYYGMDGAIDFYFTHSYKMVSDKNIYQSMCSYGDSFIASFEENNIAGAQFHPEISQANGLKLLTNFIKQF